MFSDRHITFPKYEHLQLPASTTHGTTRTAYPQCASTDVAAASSWICCLATRVGGFSVGDIILYATDAVYGSFLCLVWDKSRASQIGVPFYSRSLIPPCPRRRRGVVEFGGENVLLGFPLGLGMSRFSIHFGLVGAIPRLLDDTVSAIALP